MGGRHGRGTSAPSPPCPSDLRLCVQPHLTARWAPPPWAPSPALRLEASRVSWILSVSGGLAGPGWCVEVISGFILATVSQEGEEVGSSVWNLPVKGKHQCLHTKLLKDILFLLGGGR